MSLHRDVSHPPRLRPSFFYRIRYCPSRMFRRTMSAAATKRSIVTAASTQLAQAVRSSAHTIATAINPRTKPTTGLRLPLLVKKMERSIRMAVILAHHPTACALSRYRVAPIAIIAHRARIATFVATYASQQEVPRCTDTRSAPI